MRFPLLPKWALTNKLPAYYDWESLTAVDQTARLYATIQGLIEDYNKFADEINKAIEELINGVNSDQECFEKRMTKVIHDYLDYLDTKIKNQDKVVADAVAYMKENLSQSITDLIAQMHESGEFDEAVLNAVDNIGSRVGTLENVQNEQAKKLENNESRIISLENSKVYLTYNSEEESLNFENVEVIV